MKFAYLDESGDRGEGDTFVMAGILLDAYRLRKTTEDFDRLLQALFLRHPGSPRELKTKAFMRGAGGWNAIPGAERRQFLSDVCALAVDKGNKVTAIALSFSAFDSVVAAGDVAPCRRSYWVAAGLFLTALIQKKMQGSDGHKGLTALVMDDNKVEMPQLSDLLHRAPEWCDGLYQARQKYRGTMRWAPRSSDDRFDHIINTGFSVKSEHSSLVQVGDAVSWVYRRSLDVDGCEEWLGEKAFYHGLRDNLEVHRLTLGNCPSCEAKEFYFRAKHHLWSL